MSFYKITAVYNLKQIFISVINVNLNKISIFDSDEFF